MAKKQPAHSDADPAEVRRARIAAAVTTLVVALFAVGFIGLVKYLNGIAPSTIEEQTEEIVIEVEEVDEGLPEVPFSVLLIGSDTRKGTALYTGKATDHAQVDQHADIMTLVRIDPNRYRISLLSIPRDTVVEGQDGKMNNALLHNRPEDVVQAVYDLTGVRPNYYMMTTFSSFYHLIDALGGIDVDVPATLKVSNPATGNSITVKEGKNQHLNGEQALALARARHEYGEDQDVIRQANVRAIERAIIERVLAGGGVKSLEHLLAVVEDDVKTDIDLPALGLMIADFQAHAGEVSFVSGTGPYAGGGTRESDGQWVIEADMDTWRTVALSFMAGGDPNLIVDLPEPLRDQDKS